MIKLSKYIFLVAIALFTSLNGFAQSKVKVELLKKREKSRHTMHVRDSLLRSFNKSDTSVNSLVQKMQQYTTNFNQIKNTLADGLDTAEVSQKLPGVIKGIDKISTVANTHKSSTLRYLFVLRDNLDRFQDDLEGWQGDMDDVNTKLIQNQTDLLKFSKDTVLRLNPSDSLLRHSFFLQRKDLGRLYHKMDSVNRADLLKVNLLQDKISVSYTRTLDESDQVDSKIKDFAAKAIAGESDYIWFADPAHNDFKPALQSTLKLDELLFSYFAKSETITHLLSILFFVLIFSGLIYIRTKAIKNNGDEQLIAKEAGYLYKNPALAPLLVATSIVPYFYNHPPTVFLEIFFLVSVALALRLIRNDIPSPTRKILSSLFILSMFYAVSNLFIEISNIDRYFILLLSIISLFVGFNFYKKVKAAPDGHLPYTMIAIRIFMVLQALSFILNVTGRFSLAKIVGVTAVFNVLLLINLYVVVNIIVQTLFLHFEAKKGGNSIINWIDYNLVQKNFKKALFIIAALMWLFTLLQNLNIDDWAKDQVADLLNQSQAIGGASFTFGGFVIFIFVIWLSSLTAKVISYLYDVSAQRVTDLSIAKRKNRTSALIIRMAVFSVGFILAVVASNFPLDKLTIIISAFGVGIGFGLQNIVNNLVSGLILAFEKPINIGDVIQVDGHTGTMREIGIRSSRVVTGDGSEVIIPNGDLISHQVINWTLSNSNRQIELHVITAYGVNISKVKDVFKKVLSNRADIMDNPAPAVLVNNISESAIDFKLLFWEADISTTGSLKSQVLSELFQAISDNDIQLPSTQKDLFLHFPEGMPMAINKEEVAEKVEKKAPGKKVEEKD